MWHLPELPSTSVGNLGHSAALQPTLKVDAAGFSVADKTHLTALVQQRSESDDDDEESGAPAAKV